ncbi:MAG: hypothetical protein JOZ58_01760, partial [Acetobacteraceae bacterium]|nr:hypothetical protein [Acetobacteraceae bacterium]
RVRRPTPQAILDFKLNSLANVDSVKLWGGNEDISAPGRRNEWQHSINAAREAIEGTYHDVHCWAVTPYSLADTFEVLAEHDLVRFACHSFADTLFGDCEFHLVMVPSDDPASAAASWRRVKEEAEQTAPGSRFRPVDVLLGKRIPTETAQRRLAEERLSVAQGMEARALRAEGLAQERLGLAQERLLLAQEMETRARKAERLAEERLDLVHRMEDRALRAEAMVNTMQRSSSWRLTGALRSARATLRRVRSRAATPPS